MGKIEKTQAGAWKAQACKADPAGIVWRKQRTFRTRREAEAFVRQTEEAMALGNWPPKRGRASSAPTLAQWWSEYLSLHVDPHLAHTTASEYRKTWRLHLAGPLGDTPIDQIRTVDAMRIVGTLRRAGRSPKTINNVLGVLRACLGVAQRVGMLDAVPAVDAVSMGSTAPEFLELDELAALIDLAERQRWPQWGVMVRVAARTGMRLGELRGLQWDRVKLDHRAVVVERAFVRGKLKTTKGHETRTVPLTRDAVASLQRHAKVTGEGRFVFVAHRDPDSPVGAGTAGWALAKLSRAAIGRRIGWHVLRHTFATHLMRTSGDPRAVQALLGHKDIATTMVYSHLTSRQTRDAIASLDAALQHDCNSTGSDS